MKVSASNNNQPIIVRQSDHTPAGAPLMGCSSPFLWTRARRWKYHYCLWRMGSARLPSELMTVPNYTAWLQGHIYMNQLPITVRISPKKKLKWKSVECISSRRVKQIPTRVIDDADLGMIRNTNGWDPSWYLIRRLTIRWLNIGNDSNQRHSDPEKSMSRIGNDPDRSRMFPGFSLPPQSYRSGIFSLTSVHNLSQ